MVRIAINGLGRIGRTFLRSYFERKLKNPNDVKSIEIVAINDLSDIKTICYLIKYDSVYGRFPEKVDFIKNNKEEYIIINGKKIRFFSKPDPLDLPWNELKIDVVVDATGIFKEKEKARKHIIAGAKKVLITAPTDDSDITVVLGVNDRLIKKEHKIISMASCTTNCLAPVAKVLEDNFKIKKGFMTTIHGYTNTQNISDSYHKHLRRARAAAVNIIPTSTGATKATSKVIPSLSGKLQGLALRVPVICGSIVDFVVEVCKKTDIEEVNKKFKLASKNQLKGILDYSEEEIVSTDIIKSPFCSIVDGLLTQVQGSTIKVLAWYDNEYGYSTKLIDIIKVIANKK